MTEPTKADYWQPGCRCVLAGTNVTINGCPIHSGDPVPVPAGPVGADFSRPCGWCRAGGHDWCEGVCGCIVDHAGDPGVVRGFKRLKRMLNPEREAWTAGGWGTSDPK